MDQLFSNSITLNRLRAGPFEPYLDQFDELIRSEMDSGLAVLTMKNHAWLLASFGEWLSITGTALGDVKNATVEEYLRSRFRTGNPRNNFALVLPRLLDSLGIPTASEPQTTHLCPILSAFESYLKNERGLADCTIESYSELVRRFLADRFSSDPPARPSLSEVLSSDVTTYGAKEANRFSHKRVLLLISALRSFFRYLLLRGEISLNLAGAVPKVADWKLQMVPATLEAEEVQSLLKTCDRSTASGRRDYAILVLLARLGLRGGEVVHLTLDAVDWEAGELILFGKSRRVDRLPLPADAGKAIVAYLKNDRPVCRNRRLFLRLRPPYRGLKTIGHVVRRALRRAGLTVCRGGAHLLRYSLGHEMLRQGASLAEIGQILRHQRVDTTAIYAKVDLDALRPLAMPWPGEVL